MGRRYSGKVRYKHFTPGEDYDKPVSQLKTVGLKLSNQQVLDLIGALADAVKSVKHEIEVTGYCFVRLRDGSYHVTVTSRD